MVAQQVALFAGVGSLTLYIFDEGICGRFGLFRRIGRLHIGSLGCLRAFDDEIVSFTVCRVSVPLVLKHNKRMTLPRSLSGSGDVQRFDCQERRKAFQLESLILAQNERWRQA